MQVIVITIIIIVTFFSLGDNLKILLDPVSVRRPSTDRSTASTPTSKNPPFDLLALNDPRSKDTPTAPASVSSSASILSPAFIPSSNSHCYSFTGLLNTSPSVGESPSSGCFSPSFVPPTPSSLDSGISLKPFDPLLSLRSSLGKLNTAATRAQPPLPPDENNKPLPPPPPLKEDKGIENISSDEELATTVVVSSLPLPKAAPITQTQQNPVDPRLKKDMWKPVGGDEIAVDCTSSQYDMEFEEISGDESPVMVYNAQLEVEEISSDEEVGQPVAEQPGSDDMDISDEDTSQNENLIELNVRPSFQTPLTPPMILPPGPPPPPIPPIPMYPPPLPPPGFFPEPPYPPGAPPTDMYHPPLPPQPPMFPINGYQDIPYHKLLPVSEKNHFIPTKQWKVPNADSRKERRGQNVLYRVFEQLASILLRDYEKKVIESAAYPVLDRFWEEKYKVNVSLSLLYVLYTAATHFIIVN